MKIALVTSLVLWSLLKASEASKSDGGNLTIDTSKRWIVKEPAMNYYYPHDFLSDDRLLVYAGCSAAKFPTEITCNVTVLPPNLMNSRSCLVVLSSSQTEELKNTVVQLHSLGVRKVLLTWWTLRRVLNETIKPSALSRQIAIVDFNNCSISRRTIVNYHQNPSYVLPFGNSYEIIYSMNGDRMSRKRYDLEHKEVEKKNNFLAVKSSDLQNDNDGFAWQTMIVPNADRKFVSPWEKRYLIVEGSLTGAKISFANDNGVKKPVAVVQKFYEDHFSLRHGLLTVCGEIVFDQSVKVVCQQYGAVTSSKLKMNVTLDGLKSIEDLVSIDNLVGGGLLLLKNTGGNDYAEYKFTKIHVNKTEEVLIEKISLDCDFSSPMSKVGISNFNHQFCVYTSCAHQKDTVNDGKVTEFEIFRTCRSEI